LVEEESGAPGKARYLTLKKVDGEHSNRIEKGSNGQPGPRKKSSKGFYGMGDTREKKSMRYKSQAEGGEGSLQKGGGRKDRSQGGWGRELGQSNKSLPLQSE